MDFLRFVILFVVIPISLPVILLLFIWRFIVIKLATLLKSSKLVRAIDGLDFAFCVDSLYNEPKAGTSFIWILEGSLDPQKVLERFEKALENDEKYDYEKLKSIFPSFWMGVPFWKKVEEKFRMEDHFRVISKGNEENHKFTGDRELNKVLVEWMRKGFEKDKPLWEIMVMPHISLEGESRSVLGLKIHHMIGDGFSKLRLLEKIVDNPPVKITEPTSSPSYPPTSLKLPLTPSTLLSLPFTLSKLVQDFALHKDVFTCPKSSTKISLFTSTFSIESFKTVRKLYNKKFQSAPPPPLVLVGVSILAGTLRRFLIHQGKKVPEISNIVVALPQSDFRHPGDFKFCNFWSHAILNVNLGKESPVERLRALIENYKGSVKENNWPQGYYRMIVPLQSLLPRFLWEKITNFNMGAPLGSTNMVGPSYPVRICGKRVLQKYAYVGLLWRHSSLTCGFFSYNGEISATIVANQDVLTNTEEDELILKSFFEKEINLLIRELS